MASCRNTTRSLTITNIPSANFIRLTACILTSAINRDDADTLGTAADEFYEPRHKRCFGRITYKIEFGSQRTIVDFLTGALPNLFTETDAHTLE